MSFRTISTHLAMKIKEDATVFSPNIVQRSLVYDVQGFTSLKISAHYTSNIHEYVYLVKIIIKMILKYTLLHWFTI